MARFIRQHRTLLGYGLLFPLLVFLLKWMQWKFLILDQSADIYAGLTALFFTVFGVWLATHLASPAKTVVVEKQVFVTQETPADTAELNRLNLSKREKEVLQLLLKGYSNAEIAGTLFLSVSTVKSHVSNILLKMDVPSRTKAIEKAKRLRITA